MAFNPQVAEQGLDGDKIGVITGLVVRDVTTTTLATVIEAGAIRMKLDPESQAALGKPYAEYVFSDTAKTFTASKDTYVVVNSSGALAYEEQTVGTAKPTQAAIESEYGYGAQLIAKVTSDSDEITAVVDLADRTAAADLMDHSAFLSFAATGVGAYYWRVPTRCRIWVMQAVVLDALANTDAGTITAARGTNDIYTAITNGVITLALSSATGTRAAVAPSAYFDVAAGQTVRFTTAKATAGGTVNLQVLYSRI